MSDITCKLGSLDLKNPLIAASGTFGFGVEWQPHLDLSALGGMVTKGLSLHPRQGNMPPRLCETASGMLNSIGLANPGLEVFVRDKLPFLQQLQKSGCLVAVNMYAESQEEFVILARELSRLEGISALELNLSCPNVQEGGMAFGVNPEVVLRITEQVRAHCSLPLWVKLSPNVTNIVAIAQAAAHGGADALCLINTLLGMAIDPVSRTFRLGNTMGGLSGPAIKPVALRMVYQVAQALDIPIIGMGGIASGTDVVEFFLAGASAVQVGTANFIDPLAMPNILCQLNEFCTGQQIHNLRELAGKVTHK